MTTIAPRRGRRAINSETLKATQVFVARESGRRVDIDRLDENEQAELVALVAKVSDGIPHGCNFSRLSGKEKGRWEMLVERAAGLEPGAFARARDEERLRARVARLAARALGMPALSERQESDLLAEVHKQMTADRALWLEHIGLIVFVLACLRTGEVAAPGSRVERGTDGTVRLVFDTRLGLLGNAAGEGVGNSLKQLDHLRRNVWFDLVRSGPEVAIALGPRARRVLRSVR